jgi:hypothetical protein
MRAIRTQIIDSVPYCAENLPDVSTVLQLWNYLKPMVTFKHDPEHVELLQSAHTLFDNNVHGMAGAGDCDCFSILAAACCIALGWQCNIKLAGNTRKAPSHIYTEMRAPGGAWYVFDLTQPLFNDERKYKFYQTLPITHKQ